nr:permease [Haloplanus sp. XH21]
MAQVLGSGDLSGLTKATAFGAASSGCSFGAVAIAVVSFAGIIAFVYADLITIPVLNVYRKYYGWKVMLYILGVFFVTMAFTGFLMELLFDTLGIVHRRTVSIWLRMNLRIQSFPMESQYD